MKYYSFLAKITNMCSIGDDFQEDELPKYMEKLDLTKVKTCNKCREQPAKVLLRRKDGYCKLCFLTGTEHKFKAFLGKHRFIRRDDCVLVNYTPGHPITSLLLFLRNALGVARHKQLKFNPILIYIERNQHLVMEERLKVLEEINAHVKEFNFTIHFVPFRDYILHSRISLEMDYRDVLLKIDDNDDLDKKFDNKMNLTVQMELYKQYEYKLLVECAKKLECQHVFTCDIAIDIASQILTNVSLGRGSHLQMDVGICDTRDPDVNVIKPLRFFDIKELALYNFFNNTSPVIVREEQKDPYLSVQNLMTNFVQNLQVNFPSTITTVIKTGDKLSMDKEICKNEKCELCLLPIEARNTHLTSSEATDFSHWLSTHPPDQNLSPTERYDQAFVEFKSNSESKYCFACSKISNYLIK